MPNLLQIIERTNVFRKCVIFQGLIFLILTTNNTIHFFHLPFLESTENILVLFHYSFHICSEKINCYTLTNFQHKINKSNAYS